MCGLWLVALLEKLWRSFWGILVPWQQWTLTAYWAASMHTYPADKGQWWCSFTQKKYLESRVLHPCVCSYIIQKHSDEFDLIEQRAMNIWKIFLNFRSWISLWYWVLNINKQAVYRNDQICSNCNRRWSMFTMVQECCEHNCSIDLKLSFAA